MSFTDQRPRVATPADCAAKWSCGKPGERFRCHLCGHKFVPGDVWRWVYCGTGLVCELNGKRYGVPNFMTCAACDGEDVRARWIDRIKEYYSDRFWALRPDMRNLS